MNCIAVLGGSFDPVHNGHLALAKYFTDLFAPTCLRVIPAGNPWQKQGLQAKAEDRVAMLELAFAAQKPAVIIDQQEIQRHTASYSIDTLRALRAELGPDTSILFLIGADQLQRLHTWRDWQQLFDYAHICAATRPGFALAAMPEAVATEFTRRGATKETIRATPHGHCYIGKDLAIDISATEVRARLREGAAPEALLPTAVLDYIQQHHLYQRQQS